MQNNAAVTLDTRIVETQLRRYAVLMWLIRAMDKTHVPIGEIEIPLH